MAETADESTASNVVQENTSSTIQGTVKPKGQRTSVACDECHKKRLRCDHNIPCSRCSARHLECQFTRERRKRGRAAASSKKSTVTGQSSSQQPPSNGLSNGTLPHQQTQSEDAPTEINLIHDLRREIQPPPPRNQQPISMESPMSRLSRGSQDNQQRPILQQTLSSGPRRNTNSDRQSAPELDNMTMNFPEDWIPGLSPFSPSDHLDIWGGAGLGNSSFNVPLEKIASAELGGYHLSRPATRVQGSEASAIGPTEIPLKYPVLAPLMPFVGSALSKSLMFDLLELYFTSAFSSHMHPVCHHIHGYLLRKASFLSKDRPRICSPSLLASMLWVAALDDRAIALKISPLKRKRTCQFLCSLTLRLLQPLIHVAFRDDDSSQNGRDLASDSTSQHRRHGRNHVSDINADERGLIGPAGSLDDVITYMHVASVVSASEQKAASMRWWHAAFTLARELKLNQEIEVSSASDGNDIFMSRTDDRDNYPNALHSPDITTFSHPPTNKNCVCNNARTNDIYSPISEEYREERRRTWWLLYIMDRHLALCYNRPLALLDAECEDLLLPLDEAAWQAGNIHSNSPLSEGPHCPASGDDNMRLTFPNFTCSGPSIFGFFLPLTIIIGELIDLNQARNHPILGSRLQGPSAWDVHVNEIRRQIERYEMSLTSFSAQIPPQPTTHPSTTYQDQTNNPLLPTLLLANPALSPSNNTATSPPPSTTDKPTLIHTVIAYATHVVHVLHILLIGKWDPVSLFEDTDFWTSSPSFASATSHALSAASALELILHHDPDVSFMPYFFGIQLLHGSFLLLLITDRLQGRAGEGILKACEAVIRATEACVVTLATEYQRNFRLVMRSAVAQARGRPVNANEIRYRREAILKAYRWSRSGTGLAL